MNMEYSLNNKKKTPSWFIAIWVAILIILLAFKAFGQDRKELPIINQRILHFVDSVEGMRIGKGLCRHFVNEAIEYAIKEKFKGRRLELSRIFSWEGFNLPRKYALPGDILSLYNHVGIIYEVYKDKCYIKIAHQNGDGEGSPVTIEDYYPLLRFQPKYIRIRWQYPPESEPPCH